MYKTALLVWWNIKKSHVSFLILKSGRVRKLVTKGVGSKLKWVTCSYSDAFLVVYIGENTPFQLKAFWKAVWRGGCFILALKVVFEVIFSSEIIRNSRLFQF